jgi:hypothetical protein
MAKRKKRAASSRLSGKKRPAANAAPPQNGGPLRSGGLLGRAGQALNVARLQSGDRLPGVQVLLIANRWKEQCAPNF